MVPRKLVLSSSTLLATALLLTMLYSLARVLGASEADDTTAATSTLANALGTSPALATAPTASPTTEAALPTAAPSDSTAISATRNDEQPVIAPVSSVSTPPAPPSTPTTAAASPAGATQPASEPVIAPELPNTLAHVEPTAAPAAQPTTAPAATQQSARPAATATTQPRLNASSQGVETVRFVKEINDNVFIIYRGQELWMVEHDASCADLTVAVGGSVLIYSPGGFPASNARIVLPSRPRDCAITGATLI